MTVRHVRWRVWLGGVAVVLASGCGGEESSAPNEAPSDEQVVGALAQVNRAVLREEDLTDLVSLEDGLSGSEIGDILDGWIETELLYQEARKQGIDREPEVAKRLFELERQLLADAFLQREIKRRVHVTEDELRAYYDAHRSHYTQEVRLRQIVVASPEEARTVMEKIRAGESFIKLAKEYSIDPTAARGGDLGYLGKGAMNPAFESVVFDMKRNEVRGPIASAFGFHIVQLVGRRRAAEPIAFDTVRDEIVQELLLQKQQEAERAVLAELRARATIHKAESYAGMPLVAEDAAPDSLPPPPDGATPEGP